jgi:hypothetical protein
MFKGNYSSSIQENHQFFCDQSLEFNKTDDGDVKSAVTILKQLGIISFTKMSCKQIFDSNLKYITNTSLYSRLPASLRNIVNPGMPTNTTLINYTFAGAFYTEFNKSAGRFNDVPTPITLIDIYALISYNESRQFDSNFPKDETLEKKLIAINNSLEKAIIIRVNLFNLGEEIDFKLILHIKNIKETEDPVFKNKTTRSNERSLALNDVTIASVPETPYGQQYSYSSTSNHQSQSSSNTGSLLPADPKNKFAQDKVAGKLQTFYDPNTNTFKAGNPQMLARLLTDIDPAPLQSLPTGNLQDIAVSELVEMVSPFTTGKALPLSPQQSNPATFGPDYIECGNKKIVEITVTNRSLRKFTRDQVVMLTEINGEWIVQDFGKDAELGGGTKFGDWHFLKMIANTDSYFKDDRFYATGDFSNSITPSEYEAQSRLKFYNNKLTSLANNQAFTTIYGSKLSEIVNLNRPQGSPTVSFIPSKRYYIASIFDQLAPEACGFNDLSYLLATNVEDTAVFGDKNLLFKYAQEVPGFWGPVYSDGHSSVGYNPNCRDSGNKLFFDVSRATEDVLNNITFLKDYFPQYNGNYKLHFPAECSSTFINPSAIFNNWNNLGTTPINGSGSSIQSPFYGTSIPATRNRIQFSPLQAELAGSDDLLSTKAKDYSRQFYNIIRAVLSAKLGEGYETIGSLFGGTGNNDYNIYKRSAELLGYPTAEFLITDISKCGSPAYDNAQQSFTEIANFKSIKYDCFVNRSNSNSGLVGSPALFRKSGGTDGANCVGIISAKQTITKRSGGKLNYSLSQDFGLNQQRASTLATNFITIIPGIFSGGGSAGGGMQYGFPQWGSTTDNINSFGTTALHLRIFDSWPEIDTIFDPRYFGILHFNPNDDSMDISIPTLDVSTGGTTTTSTSPPTDPFANILQLGGTINSTTKLLPKVSWAKSSIRRGMLLTNGGFKYFAHQIGLKDGTGSVVNGGAGFTSNFEYEIKNKNVVLLLTVSGNAVTGVSIKDGSSVRHHTISGIDNKHRGINFLPSDFNMDVPKFTNGELDGVTGQKAFVLSIPPQVPGQTSKAAIIKFTSGEVYFEEKTDLPPTEQVPLTRLTSSSKRGEDFVQETKESDFTLESNKSGKYDCFYHFHNDITHTLMTDQPFVAGFLQHVTMTIT